MIDLSINVVASYTDVVRHTKNTVKMKVKSYRQNTFILCCTFLMAATISCNSQSQANKENQIVHSKDDSQG
jgi:hypothetical protein